MIIVTGAAGFIGSCLVNKLNNKGIKDIVIVDDYSNPAKSLNINNKIYTEKLDRKHLFDWIREHHHSVRFVYHLGARTDTAETDKSVFDSLNVNYSKRIWEYCTEYQIPLVYASSAATYGAGENGYSDDLDLIPRMKPLNAYGDSKQAFDRWVLEQKETPPLWAGLKFFNVYGPNEYHKNRMASVVYHAYKQIRESGEVKLFKSHKQGVKDGEQKRDFIYVKDVIDICYFFMMQKPASGIYNVGTGQARTFYDLVRAIFKSIDKYKKVTFVDTPADIRANYQYFTEAKIDKLRAVGYDKTFYSIEAGVQDYIQSYMLADDRHF